MTDLTPMSAPPPQEETKLRMKDLCSATGLPRQAIHFYIQQGLVPPGKKTGRNMAHYGAQHLERLQLILRLKNERFLPLKAIKALLDGQDHDFTPGQRRFLAEVKSEFESADSGPVGSLKTVDASQVISRTGLDKEDLERALELELLAGRRNEAGQLMVAERDVWVLEVFGEMRQQGFTRELGFNIEDVTFYGEILDELFQRELQLVSSRLAHIPPTQAAEMIRNALPIVHHFLSLYHEKRVREFFASLT